jgi:hypothetical protein
VGEAPLNRLLKRMIFALIVGCAFLFIPSHWSLGYGNTLLRLGFPFAWYDGGIADLEGYFQSISGIGLVLDIVCWSAIAFVVANVFHAARHADRLAH